MDYSARNELVSSLQKDATFASFSSNVDRVSYVLEKYITSERIHHQVKENLEAVAKKVTKCSHKADCFTQEAKLHMTAKDGTAALAALRKALLYTLPGKAIQKVKLYLMMFQVYFKHLAKYEEALWAIEQTMELLQKQQPETTSTSEGTLDSKMAHILYLKATALEKLHRSEEAMQIVQRLIASRSTGTSQTPIAKKLKQTNLKKFLKKLKEDVKTPSYSADLKQWRESHLAEVLPSSSTTSSLKSIAVRGSTAAEYRINEQQVRIENSANIGRHFVANGIIPAETVILQERPISLAVQPTVLGVKCTACYHDLGHRYVPCEECTRAVYCDSGCAQADALVHSTTCGGMKELLYEKVGTFAMHLLQLITRVGGPKEALEIQRKLADEGYSIDQYLEEKKALLSGKDKNVLLDHQLSVVDYKMACILASNEDKQTLESHVKYTVMALETAIAIIFVSEKEGDNGHLLDETDFLVPFAARLTTNLRQLSYNVFGWTDWALDLYVGNCQALVGSLVNHSCVANTKWEWKDGVISFVTKREVAAGEHITISYGPSDWQSYSTRQERLNHYLFGCACAACLKDAAAGSAVKCTNCTLGPVVYDTPLNAVPCISGKCLQCFALHPSFADSTARLKETISQAKVLTTVVNASLPSTTTTFSSCSSSESGGKKVLQSAQKLLSTLHQLALPTGKATIKSTLAVASVLLLSCAASLEQLAIEERVHIADMVDQCLPTALPTELLNSTMMRTIFGWFHLVLKWSEEFNLTPHSQSVVYEPRDCLHLVLQFHRRCQEALKCMMANVQGKGKEDDVGLDDHKVFSAIVNKQLHLLDMKLDKYREVF